MTGQARIFTNVGNNVLDARGTTQGVVLYGGAGDDTLYGGAGNDLIAGGGGNNTIDAGQGNNHVYGNAGFNLDLSKRLSLASPDLLTVVLQAATTDQPITHDALVVGNNTIMAGDGNNIVFGTLGVITQLPGTMHFVDNGSVTRAESVDFGAKGNNAITVGNGNNWVLGGVGQDSVTAGNGNNVVLGDDGQINFVPGIGQLVSVQTTQLDAAHGGNDKLTVGNGLNVVLGGVGADTLVAGNGDNLLLGDNGFVGYTAGVALALNTTDSQRSTGGDDRIRGGNGNNLVLGGVGADGVTLGNTSGVNVVLGDSGRIERTAPGVFTTIESTNLDGANDTTLGGNDSISSGDGSVMVIAGVGDDQITLGQGLHVVAADNASLQFDALGQLRTAQTLVPDVGGDDLLVAGNGDALVLGGQGNDSLSTGDGNSTVLGDNGVVVLDAKGLLASVISSEPGIGGADVVQLGQGDHVVVAGLGDDDVALGDGSSVIVGDSGRLIVGDASNPTLVRTDAPSQGGNDRIQAGNGDHVVLGGVGSDVITLGNGNPLAQNRSVVLGDNGEVLRDAGTDQGKLLSAISEQPGIGGEDLITLGNGNHVVIAGLGDDSVKAGNGDAKLLGDSGRVVLDASLAPAFIRTDAPSQGGNDSLVAGNGDSMVLGGIGNDSITVGNGNVAGSNRNIVLGDNGLITLDAKLQATEIITTSPELGGDDTVVTGTGNNIVLGGNGADDVLTGDGNAIQIGDNGQIKLQSNFVLLAQTIDLYEGGNDTLHANTGNNIVMGGFGNDLLYGTLSSDVLIGDYGSVVQTPEGKVTSVTRFAYALNAPDLIAATQDAVFTTLVNVRVGPTAGAAATSERNALINQLASTDRSGISVGAERTSNSHGGSEEIELVPPRSGPETPGEKPEGGKGEGKPPVKTHGKPGVKKVQKPAKPGKPVKAAKPDAAPKAAKPAAPAKAVQPAQPTQPTQQVSPEVKPQGLAPQGLPQPDSAAVTEQERAPAPAPAVLMAAVVASFSQRRRTADGVLRRSRVFDPSAGLWRDASEHAAAATRGLLMLDAAKPESAKGEDRAAALIAAAQADSVDAVRANVQPASSGRARSGIAWGQGRTDK